MLIIRSEIHNRFKPENKLTAKLNIRKVFAEFTHIGVFTDCNGNKIFEEDFKSVYVADGTATMNGATGDSPIVLPYILKKDPILFTCLKAMDREYERGCKPGYAGLFKSGINRLKIVIDLIKIDQKLMCFCRLKINQQ